MQRPLAKETAELFIHHVFCLHGLPTDIVSDRGPQFTAQFWRAFCKLIRATCSLTSDFHPQTNSQAERASQALEVALRCMASRDASSWSKYLPWIEYAHNTLPSSATGLSPFQCSLGYQPPLFPNQEEEVVIPSAQIFIHHCRRTWALAWKRLIHSTLASKRQADKHCSKAPTYSQVPRTLPHQKGNQPMFCQTGTTTHHATHPLPLATRWTLTRRCNIRHGREGWREVSQLSELQKGLTRKGLPKKYSKLRGGQ
ncbi:uncharacterized protein LOC132900229 [Neoarius graeffei]|uniref:uncharacterized protein LOC132900229 n=1 Tax=Neoarius graeffei TaxID=443677 RepID=UPI00298C0935|nr:uncharacterized protein LOC132900229 [Neoarius graeffei]